MLQVHDTKIEANHGLYYNSCIKGENNINSFHIPKATALLVYKDMAQTSKITRSQWSTKDNKTEKS
jgi:hypothetical protein